MTVILAPAGVPTFVVLPLTSPSKLPHLLLPLIAAWVIVPPLTVYVPIVEDSAALIVHVMPNVGSLIVHSAPTIVSETPVMFGSAPVKPRYLRCHGRLSLLTVALPLAHLVTLPAVT